jgi:phospholipid transport system substrate-binding protein
LPLPAFADPAAAQNFVATNIQQGFAILNDKTLSVGERRARFADFLLGITDERRVALFLLGAAASSTAPADIDAYLAAYHDYVLSVYRTYFALYSGESLKVISARERAADDTIVVTNVVGGSTPLEIDFRVRTDGGKPVLVDVAVAGVWLIIAQRDQFRAVLAASNNDVKALTAHLKSIQTALH